MDNGFMKTKIDLNRIILFRGDAFGLKDKFMRGIDAAELIANAKWNHCIETNSRPKYGQNLKDTKTDLLIGWRGAIGVCIHFDIQVKTEITPDFLDFGKTEIRTTRYVNGKLIGWRGEEKTKFDKIFIHCSAPLNENFIYINGWLFGFDFLLPQNFKDHFGFNRPSYAISQNKLKLIDDLIKKNNRIEVKN
jgi:hypothetical protein